MRLVYAFPKNNFNIYKECLACYISIDECMTINMFTMFFNIRITSYITSI